MFDEQMWKMIWTAFQQTMTMVLWSTLFSVLLGFIPAILLTLTAPDGLRPNRPVYSILSFIVNVFRPPSVQYQSGMSGHMYAATASSGTAFTPCLAKSSETSARIVNQSRASTLSPFSSK